MRDALLCPRLMVRVVSWNVNGIRTLKPSLKEALDALDADIVCLQETKVQSNADEQVCLVPGYHSFFSFCRTRTGYSGTATFTRIPRDASHLCITPVDAGEGFDNTVGGANANWLAHVVALSEDKLSCSDEAQNQPQEFYLEDVTQICSEGRVVITDHAHFVCINIYAPAVSVEGRARFKLAFNRALELKVRALRGLGRRVLVAGDFNIAPHVLDVAEKVHDLVEFDARPSRSWLRRTFFRELGMVDSFRELNPHLRDAYTCWSEATRARETNFGVRIDLILVDRQFYDEDVERVGLHCEVLGSDHCPVSLDIRDDPFVQFGLNGGVRSIRDPPAFCTKFYKRFVAKQSSISSFLGKVEKGGFASQPLSGPNPQSLGPSRGKRVKNKPVVSDVQIKKRGRQNPTRQLSIGTFFTPREASRPAESPDITGRDSQASASNYLPQRSGTAARNGSDSDAVKKWQQLLSGPPPPPLCRHREPCQLKSVKKSGENRGRTFFSCSRPAGQWPTDRNANCNYFSWAPYKANTLPKSK